MQRKFHAEVVAGISLARVALPNISVGILEQCGSKIPGPYNFLPRQLFRKVAIASTIMTDYQNRGHFRLGYTFPKNLVRALSKQPISHNQKNVDCSTLPSSSPLGTTPPEVSAW